MLRITTQAIDDTAILLKLEGKLLGPWADELKRCVHGCLARRHTLKLDLSALTFADAVGTQLLADLIRQGASLTACSGYLAALLQMEQS